MIRCQTGIDTPRQLRLSLCLGRVPSPCRRFYRRIEIAARGQDRERGASTLEIVFWAVALLALAGIVYAAINGYIQNKLPGIS